MPSPHRRRGDASSKTTTTSANETSTATASKLISIAFATGFWYFSSSINAVASQKLFSGLKKSESLQQGLDELATSSGKSIISMAVILTVSQLTVGGILSLAFLFFVGAPQPSDMAPDNNNTSETESSTTTTTSRIHRLVDFFQGIHKLDLAIGLLHCVGSIFTNIGYGFGSASLVQVIKLLEPIETLLLTALVQRSLQALSFKKVTSTFTIIGGTYMLLKNPSIDVNPKSVLFAIGSGMCMASRNVLSKTRQQKPSSHDHEVANSFRAILHKGMKKFATITVTSAVSALVLGGLMALSSLPLFKILVPQLLEFSPKILNQTIVFHCLYNMASITVLSLTSATTHSLMNVGKRIANVMIASVAFSIPLTVGGKVGLCVAAVGATFYNDKTSAAILGFITHNQPQMRCLAIILVLGIMVLVQLRQPVESFLDASKVPGRRRLRSASASNAIPSHPRA
mmetsp:Transcript_22574/g.55939  ORF Transcript_22574/g.55939 Transcript_22574/m.55939 type:complete len:456 (-) Transcript_22574:1863-3230(-)